MAKNIVENDAKLICNIDRILSIHDRDTEQWHDADPVVVEGGFYACVQKNHMHNFILWHEEDKARRDDKGYEFVYRAKRNIDYQNQRRNNAMEAMDAFIFKNFQWTDESPDMEYHSETPGMMIDRLSILALKQYHMAVQVDRRKIDDEGRMICQEKLAIIEQQRQHLAMALRRYIDKMAQGVSRFYLYHQFKMYNDPSLNPQLYNHEK